MPARQKAGVGQVVLQALDLCLYLHWFVIENIFNTILNADQADQAEPAGSESNRTDRRGLGPSLLLRFLLVFEKYFLLNSAFRPKLNRSPNSISVALR